MLTRTFLHLSGIGPKRERAIWADGILSWDDMLKDRDLFDDGPPPLVEKELAVSRQKLAEGDARWFEKRLGHADAWRLAPDFDDGRIAYLDIETDGAAATHLPEGEDAPGGTTVCSVWDGLRARVFLRNRDLHELPQYLNGYRVLCTFNGRIFDIPYLEARFGAGFFRGAHLDLRPITRAVGLTGGLKKIEKQVGIERPEAIRRYTGYDAVKLWSAYRRGRTDALDPLARYNLADAVNLQALLRVAYNWAVAHDELPFRRFDMLQAEDTREATEKAVKQVMRAGATG
ncbi:MAG: ribonuclease H-like domain-containing protein [Planctomycetota bacterium]